MKPYIEKKLRDQKGETCVKHHKHEFPVTALAQSNILSVPSKLKVPHAGYWK